MSSSRDFAQSTGDAHVSCSVRHADAWRPQVDEIERRYPARTPLPPGYRVIWHEGSEHYHWITEDGRVESAPTWNHWDCWRGAWAHYRAALSDAAPQARTHTAPRAEP
jgi:hypothetical protein